MTTEHLKILAKELACEIKWYPAGHRDGMMYVEFDYIEIPIVTDQISFLIGLHELGHVYWGHTQGRPPHGDNKFYFENGVLKSEAQAWDWAMDQYEDFCEDPITDESRKFMWDICLGSYYQHALQMKETPTRLFNGNRHHVQFVYDKPDVYFSKVVKKIMGNIPKDQFNIEYQGN